jgi:hypothetical protein
MAHVRPAVAHTVPRSQVFSLWRIRGRKRLLHAGADLILYAHHGSQSLRACIAPALADGAACRVSLPFDGNAAAHRAQLRLLLGDHPPESFRRVSRIDVLHLRALQALDALQAGCGQRGVAEAVFGADRVAEHWHADSDMRAQVRHILSRAKGLMTGGYLQLAGVLPR